MAPRSGDDDTGVEVAPLETLTGPGAAWEGLYGDRRHEGPVYPARAYASLETAPPGSDYASHHQQLISPDTSVFKTPTNPGDPAWQADVRRLYTLDPVVRRAFWMGPEGPERPTTEEERRLRIFVHEIPIEWV